MKGRVVFECFRGRDAEQWETLAWYKRDPNSGLVVQERRPQGMRARHGFDMRDVDADRGKTIEPGAREVLSRMADNGDRIARPDVSSGCRIQCVASTHLGHAFTRRR